MPAQHGVLAARGRVSNWIQLLNQWEEEPQCRALRRASFSGQPFGDEEFAERLRALRGELTHPGEQRSVPARRHEIAVAAGGANQ